MLSASFLFASFMQVFTRVFRFHSRLDETYIDVNPNVGEALISHSMMLHEGLATTKGTRYILVGFDDVDEKGALFPSLWFIALNGDLPKLISFS